ncbi:hypothetical protein ACFSC3_00230 [Sphingomonas floccifaciens]|uniref:Isopropylmalate isomerase n=1 Tax=Sphingomonas floccifaciens TaxID=1844115 RepID=A0ABW4N764_9SPHN
MVFGWSPGIGDPTAIGWSIVAAYLVTAALCWWAGRVSLQCSGRSGTWPILAAALLALGINKQLDLQALVVVIGRRVAFYQGWYEDRRFVQMAFITVLFVAAILLCRLMARLAAKGPPQERRALLGIVVLATFVLIRAASFHHVDRLLGANAAHLRINHLLELGGIALIAVPALLTCIERRPATLSG